MDTNPTPSSDDERYTEIDLPFYRGEVAPALPPRVLDFHTHTWERDHWREVPWESDVQGGKYMVTWHDYGPDALLGDARRAFPDRESSAVCFGYPSPAADTSKTNAGAALAGERRGLYPLMVTGRDMLSKHELEREITENGFFGFKVYLNWHGDDYGSVRVENLIGPNEMELADDLRLVVLLHVPRAGRLADPDVQDGVRRLSSEYPRASIVLAHCGRAYLPDEMKRAIHSVRDLQNVFLDTAMVMDPTVLQIVFNEIDSRRVLFGTDFPVAAMRGRRVYVMDHWVDVVLDGYPPSAYRVPSSGIRATFMAWEIVLAIRRAAEMAGLSAEERSSIFHDNGMALLRRVLDGRQIDRAHTRWGRSL